MKERKGLTEDQHADSKGNRRRNVLEKAYKREHDPASSLGEKVQRERRYETRTYEEWTGRKRRDEIARPRRHE